MLFASILICINNFRSHDHGLNKNIPRYSTRSVFSPINYLLYLFLISIACNLRANDLADSDEASDTDVIELAPYIVNANRFDELSDNIPVNIEVITREDIEHSGTTNLVELLEQEGDVFFRSVTGNASQAEIDLRGFGENSGVRTLVLVDGVKLNRPDIGALNWLQIPLEDIESVEVMQGAQTALYGNHAVGGVIKITTRRGQGPVGGRVSGTIGNFGLYEAGGSVSGSTEQVQYLASGSFNQLDGYRDNSNYTAQSANFNLGYDPDDKWHLGVSGSWNQTDSIFPGGLTLQQANDNPRQSLTNPDTSFSNEKIFRVDGITSYAISDDDRFELNSGYLYRDLSWNLEGPGADNLIQTVIVSPKQIIEFGAWKWIFGADYTYDSLAFTIFQNNDRSTATQDGELHRNSLGIYTHAQYQVSTQMIVSAGVRGEFTQLQGNNNDLTDPSNDFSSTKNDYGYAFDLGMVYKLDKQVRFWGRFSRLYRYPATDEIAAYQGFPLLEPFNFNLDPETGYDLELGVDWIDAPWFANANLFGMWINGEIGFDFTQNLNTNLGNAQRLGADISVGYLPNPVGLSVNYQYIDAKYTSGLLDGLYVWLVPRHRVYVELKWRIIDGLVFTSRYNFVSNQLQGNDINNNLPKLPYYNLVDFMLRYQFTAWGEVFVALDNATDEQYFSTAFSGVYYPASGRTYKGGVNLRF